LFFFGKEGRREGGGGWGRGGGGGGGRGKGGEGLVALFHFSGLCSDIDVFVM